MKKVHGAPMKTSKEVCGGLEQGVASYIHMRKQNVICNKNTNLAR